jgi:hypothetical protein
LQAARSPPARTNAKTVIIFERNIVKALFLSRLNWHLDHSVSRIYEVFEMRFVQVAISQLCRNFWNGAINVLPALAQN